MKLRFLLFGMRRILTFLKILKREIQFGTEEVEIA